MKSLLKDRRPSPSLIVACLALFISLSGVSYGVATGFIDSREIKNNEIRSLDIRNNEVRTKDIRNNEVRGIDIRNSTVQGRDIGLNAVTGEDVKEDTLQKVPSAITADSATSVGTLAIIPLTTVATGSSPVVLATHGPLTLSAECATATVARLTVSTTEDNSAAGGTPGSQSPDLDAADSPFQIAQLTAPSPAYAQTTAAAFAPSGKGFTGNIALYRDASGSGACKFHGHLALQG
ncbi:MAG: hypothetical protein QOE69_2044 [Thermoleophilaceae bacterium]|nr:hypothetical protein [Thermoleophilaceae bacterium]MEA2407925.1 hypothetical protein [Thermoleophilaceae bacterium]